MTMELWHAWACPFSARVRVALAEKGVAWTGREVDLANKPTELKALNPAGGVPVLVDGDRVVPDSLRILEYLDERYPAPLLLPPPGPARDAVKALYERVGRLLGPHLPRIARGTPDERDASLAAVRDVLAGLEAETPARGFLAGPPSVADLALLSLVDKLPAPVRPAALGLPRLARWEAEIRSRPAVRAALEGRSA
jgi:stringent starvation protein A